MDNLLKDLRIKKKLTQKEAANIANISLRSYIMYENNPDKIKSIKYQYIIDTLKQVNYIDEDHGILSIEEISEVCSNIFNKYPVDFCYIFGSYAKEKANEKSDVDLLISTSLKGISFFGLVEELRTCLQKKVDVLDINQLKDNIDLIYEVLKDGIKIYG